MHVVNFKVIKYIVILLLSPAFAIAQDTLPHRFAITAGYQYGFLIAHRPMVVPLQQNKVNGFELSLVFRSNGSKDWHHIYAFPQAGLSISLWDIGNPEQIGKVTTLIPYLDFPLAKGKKTSFDLKFGWGIGYVQKKFDADDNYKNVAIGSRLNFALILQPAIKIHLNDRLTLSSGLSMTHYSNGSIETPNLGMNIASLSAGITWNIGKPMVVQQKSIAEFRKSNHYSIFVAGSTKQIYPADGINYFVSSLSANRSWKISRKSAFGTGADIFYDHSTFQKAENQDITLTSDLQAFKAGIHGSYELGIDDLSFIVNLGVYVYSKLDDGTFYQRVGMRYNLSEKLFACIHLKAHWGKADFAEFGLGYKFGKKVAAD